MRDWRGRAKGIDQATIHKPNRIKRLELSRGAVFDAMLSFIILCLRHRTPSGRRREEWGAGLLPRNRDWRFRNQSSTLGATLQSNSENPARIPADWCGVPKPEEKYYCYGNYLY